MRPAQNQKRNPSTPQSPKKPFYKANENEKEMSGSQISKDGTHEKSIKASVERLSPDQEGYGHIIPESTETANTEEAQSVLNKKIKDKPQTQRSSDEHSKS